MKPIIVTTVALTEDANGIAVDQTTAGAADLDLDGVLVTGGIATAAETQSVSIEGAGNSSGITFAITGTDPDGNTLSESITGPKAGTLKNSLERAAN